MLSRNQFDNAKQATNYFFSGPERGEEGQELRGTWQGRGAEKLGLKGEIHREDFAAMCNNMNPFGGERLTQRNKNNRRVALDLCQSGPKSASILFGLTGDPAILQAFIEANRYMMSIAESEFACTRVRKGGAQEDRLTGNLVWAEFVHLTARPVDGVPEPHIHIHNVILNHSYDAVEQCWKATQLGRVVKAGPFLDALFLSDFARRVEALGYRVEKRERGWEITGYSKGLLEKFSNRTSVIKSATERLRNAKDWVKSRVGATTREKKSKDMTMAELRDAWSKRLTASERATVFNHKRVEPEARPATLLAEAVKHSITASFERSAVVRETTLLAEALLYRPGKLELDEIRAEMKMQGVVWRELKGWMFVTTMQVAAEEQRMLNLVKSGRGKFTPILESKQKETLGKWTLDRHELRAARHILESRDEVIIVRATPHTDLRKVMGVVARGTRNPLRWRGVKRIASSAAVAREPHGVLGRNRGKTVHEFLNSTLQQYRARNTFVWIEDAGRVGTQDMTKLMEAGKKFGFRLVLTSSSRTEHGATRGDPLHVIERHSNTSTLRLDRSSRVKGQHREVLGHLYRHDVNAAMGALKEMERLHEHAESKAFEAMSRECAALHQKGRRALIVVHNEAAKHELNAMTRRALQELRMQWHKGWKYSTLQSRNLSVLQRQNAASYRRGDIVQIDKKILGFKPGSQWKVVGRDRFGRVIARNGLQFEALPLHKAERFSVYERRQLKIHAGEMIRITKNGWATGHGLNGQTSALDWARGAYQREVRAGDLFKVKRISWRGDIVLENGLTLPRSFQHYEYGYAVTANAAKKPRVDWVLYGAFQPEMNGVDADNMAGWMAKAKRSGVVYTDQKDVLLNGVNVHGDRRVAMDIVQPAHEDGTLNGERHANRGRQQEQARQQEQERQRERDRERERTMER